MKKILAGTLLFLCMAAPAYAKGPTQFFAFPCQDGTNAWLNGSWQSSHNRFTHLTVADNCQYDALTITYRAARATVTINVTSNAVLGPQALRKLPAFTEAPVFSSWVNDGPDGPCVPPGGSVRHHYVVQNGALVAEPHCSSQVGGSE